MTNSPCVIYWFRRDYRLDDNPALMAAIATATQAGCPLLAVAISPSRTINSVVGELDRGATALAWAHGTQNAMHRQLQAMGQQLHLVADITSLRQLAERLHVTHIFCESIALPYETDEVTALSVGANWSIQQYPQSSLFNADMLPFPVDDVPLVFTAFRQAIEKASLRAAQPLAPVRQVPPPPSNFEFNPPAGVPVVHHPRSSMAPDRMPGETGARRHWADYLAAGHPHRYFETRNQLSGHHFSSQLSVDLAWGTLSVRRVVEMLDAFEMRNGASKSSYWLWFELMWREHFRWLHQRFGVKLFHARGLAKATPPRRVKNPRWTDWCRGETGQPLIDAGMRELVNTGFLSNRMRQIVASYWLNDLGGEWRAGAAWFESQLCDEDCFSNTGNWLYIAGLGSDPRGGRRFDPVKQMRDHDPAGRYQRLWGVSA